ncbi:DUF4097 family beta strand repeat-containing protein [Streptomyces mirabilis]
MYEFPANGPVTASIRIPGGTCTVRAGNGHGISVEAAPAAAWRSRDRKAAESTVVNYAGGVLTVLTGERGGWIKGRVRLDVSLPAGSVLEFASDSADLEIHGRLASLTVDTSSGGVEAEHVTGDVRLDVASSDTQLGTVGGSLAFAARSGELRVDHTAGAVSGKSTSGDMRLGTTEGDVRLETSSGDVRIGTVHGGAVYATTSSGDVSVGVEKGLGVQPRLQTNSGDQRGDLAAGAPSAGGADVVLKITTASGDITIRRA